ncbi:structure-specific endonuclease subunit SLX4 [Cebus imitator]|uniref:Structure-specific endonuclease subunit SLX4 n=1 Tax=Cebus imitator TaxID=2715852 RepID=A0A2K5QC72_CEBIM|nr:structure-specific endonuclease subunit SLX4 [Cebus imitator]XP_017359970.1 structure-specific endonuclease subunit SLX4 [Cebus imitator]XP_037585834.1 structure-specific endonuclease subunit SLX4 [Cebus imitator]
MKLTVNETELGLGSLSHPTTCPWIDPHSSEDQPESLKTGQMMDESDEDFKELCASFFQRVKKRGTKEVSGERKAQKAASNGTQIRSKFKRTKQTATKSKTLQRPAEKKSPSGSQASRAKKQVVTKCQASEPALTVNGEGGVLASAPDQPVLWETAQNTQTGNWQESLPDLSREETRENVPDSDSQPPPSCLTAAVPSPSKPRTAKLVLQRMQQFKRADPERLRHTSEECSLQAAPEENVPKSPQEEMMAENGDGPGLPAPGSDAVVALALQQEFARVRASAHDDSLEEKGLFFCQICQKNLSAMNVTRREQHVNRCLDEDEKALRPSAPQIPECPICGKQFLTLKSRTSHLKQCAVKMEVGPQLLLQAVRLQTAQPEGSGSPSVSSFSNHGGGLKRRGPISKKEPRKRRKIDETPSEDLLMAMALSRSEMEPCAAVPALRLESAFSERIRPEAEKKSRKKKPPGSPPLLLVQDSETTGRQIEDRVDLLLSEEVELSSTPPLPTSRILKKWREKAGWCLPPPEGKQSFLWEGSALTGAWAVEAFYTASLVPPIVPQRPAQGLTQEAVLPLVPPEQSEPGTRRSPALHSTPPAGCDSRELSPSASQREHQALQDLMDLAREGFSASQWPGSGGLAGSEGATGLDMVPSSLPLTGFVVPSQDKQLDRGGCASLSLGLLVSDFGAMVNNPHLSDVQFQTDSGEVLYAHKFVLYARCPLLIQYVNNEGFSAVEDGVLTQRVLLGDVSTEAARTFLHYLYTADTDLPPGLSSELSSLAHRFGVSELVQLCEQVPAATDSEGKPWEEKEAENCQSRAENFQELLRSMWADEEEEVETLLKSKGHEEDQEKVNEEEMEEIYEFAATQRKLLQEVGASGTGEDTDWLVGDSPGSGQLLASVQMQEQQDKVEEVEPSGLGNEAATTWKKVGQSTHSLPQGQCSGTLGLEAPEQEAPNEALGHSSCSSPSGGCQAERKESSLPRSDDARDYEQLFSSTQGAFSEPSQITSEPEEQGGTVRERGLEVSHRLAPWQASPPHPCCFLLGPPQGGSPCQSHHPHRTSGSALSTPRSRSRTSQVGSPTSLSPAVPSKQKRERSVLTLSNEPGQKGKECLSMLECRDKGVVMSPEKSLSIDLTQSNSSPRSQKSSSKLNKDDEVILLLDSDEELELEKSKKKSVFSDPLEEKKALEISPRSCELFSIIDVDADQEPSQSPPGREASLQQEDKAELPENRGSWGSTGAPWLSCDRESSPKEGSTTDTSWLVPATPLAGRSRDCSSQTQISSLRSGPAVEAVTQHMPRPSVGNREGNEAAQKLSVIRPQTPSSCCTPVSPGTSDGRRQGHRSPSCPYPEGHLHSSPLAPCPISGGHTHFSRRFLKHSPPGPSFLNQTTVTEVVELGDSDDEQEVASHQANSSPPLHSDPPVPIDNGCWHMEPLSPIPIDHWNLERTGPLSTSSPSLRLKEAADSCDCCSPGLLDTTPIRGSCTAHRKSQEKSSGVGSLGNSRLNALNSALWDDWDWEEQRPPETPPPTQTLSTSGAQKPKVLETPKGANRKKNLPPKVPITPMPQYSIMETPVLKKELDRFGVRPLPKRQMVLKLKEIFQYTHQTLDSDSEDESQSSQVLLQAPHCQTLASQTCKPSRAAVHAQQVATTGPEAHRPKGPAKTKGPRHQKKHPESITPLSRSPVKEAPPGLDDDAQLPASQESVATSVDGSDSSLSSQSSSSCEFGAAFVSAGEEEEGEDEVSASQAAVHVADTDEALRCYIRSKPALYQKVLLYQPFELGELKAELKQNGLHVSSGRLLDFLDTHCITFTTAAARREKLQGRRRQPRGKKKAEHN